MIGSAVHSMWCLLVLTRAVRHGAPVAAAPARLQRQVLQLPPCWHMRRSSHGQAACPSSCMSGAGSFSGHMCSKSHGMPLASQCESMSLCGAGEGSLWVRQAPVLDASACPAGVQRPPAPCGAGVRTASPPSRSLCADAGSALPPYFRWSSLHMQAPRFRVP